jgi:hypothetical protein
MTESTPARPQRRTLYLMLALFFVPLAASFTLYYGVGWRPAGGANHGELIQPIRQLPATMAELEGRWALIYVGDGACDEACRHTLYIGRQVHTLLNKDMRRVQRVLVATANCCDRAFLAAEHEGIHVIDAADAAIGQPLRDALPAGDHSNHLFIVDPMRNLVLRFDARENPKGLLDDLKKLLKLSHIG